MSERPFMQLYVSDFVGDTLMLSAEHVGAYLLLLIALWNADGYLPNDEVKLARVARVGLKKWKKIAVELMPFFEVADGKISHGRLTRELQKSERQSESRAISGALGGVATALKNNKLRAANAAAMPQHLPEPYRKKGNSISKDGANAPKKADRLKLHRDDEVFREIGRLRTLNGQAYPPYDAAGCWTFPSEEVDAAQKSLSLKAINTGVAA